MIYETCPTCKTDYDIHDCPVCDTEFCDNCAGDGKAFTCETCHKLHCTQHGKSLANETFCPKCWANALEAAYEETIAELDAMKRQVVVYEETCATIADLSVDPFTEWYSNIPGIEWAILVGRAKAMAQMAPTKAREAALRAA